MGSNRERRFFGKGLFVALLVAIAAFALGKVESAHAQDETILVGQTVSGWIPTGEEIRWYKLEASPDTLVSITMTRKERELVPYLALRYHDGQDYQFLAVDHNDDWSATAQVSAVLPVSANGYWIEAASLGSTAGTFSLTTSSQSLRNRNSGNDTTLESSGYKVTFTIDRIVCHDTQDSDGLDELNLRYEIVQRTPHGTAVDVTEAKVDDMWMQAGWEFDNFWSLTRRVGKQDGVSLTIKLTEDDDWPNADETLANGTNPLTAGQLEQIAASGNAAPFYWPVGNGEYSYAIYYSVHVEYVYGLNIS